MLFGGSSSAAALRNTVGIFGYASQAWVDASAYGSRIAFEASANGATARTERMGIEGNGLVSFGGSTTSFPAIKRTGTTAGFRLADDSGDAPISAGAGTFSGAISASNLSGTNTGDQTGTTLSVTATGFNGNLNYGR